MDGSRIHSSNMAVSIQADPNPPCSCISTALESIICPMSVPPATFTSLVLPVGMSVKTVQRYLWLNDLVPDLKKTMDEGKLSFTPAVEISRIRAKHQKYIAVSIEGQQSSPSQGQAKRLRELDKENQLKPDVIDAILSEEKKKEDRDVIITGAELEKYFGKEASC